MSVKKKSKILFPGTFDPITNGHLDVISRAAGLFDELVIGVGENPSKSSMLPLDQRTNIIRQIVAEMDNVHVETYQGLTVDFARKIGATAILRGIRNNADLNTETQMALTNRAVAGIETIFVVTGPQHAFISSSLIRQIARMGGDISTMVPAVVQENIRKTLNEMP